MGRRIDADGDGRRAWAEKRLAPYLSEDDLGLLRKALLPEGQLVRKMDENAAPRGPRQLLGVSTMVADDLFDAGLWEWYSGRMNELPNRWIDPREYWMAKI